MVVLVFKFALERHAVVKFIAGAQPLFDNNAAEDRVHFTDCAVAV